MASASDAARALCQRKSMSMAMGKANAEVYSALVCDHVRNKRYRQALHLCTTLSLINNNKNAFTLTAQAMASLFKACAALHDNVSTRLLHGLAIKSGALPYSSLVKSSLAATLCQFSPDTDPPHRLVQLLFDQMPPDSFCFNALIAAYVRQSLFRHALQVLSAMKGCRIKPRLNCATALALVRASANLAALGHGMQLHAFLFRNCFISTTAITSTTSTGAAASFGFLENALCHMYAKCGSLDCASAVFERMRHRDASSWNAIILGFARHGRGMESIQLFNRMEREMEQRQKKQREEEKIVLVPDGITFLGLLCACANCGFLEQGCTYFRRMSADYGIAPGLQHYALMINLVGRHGSLDEACDLVAGMPMRPTAVIWRTLLTACCFHSNFHMAKLLAQHLVQLQPHYFGNYVLLANVCVSMDRRCCNDATANLSHD